MKTLHALPIAAAISLSLLGACSKPADPAAVPADAATTTTTTTAATNATDSGGAVSPAAPNGAVNADANRTSGDVAAASNSFTESQAKGHIENAGYTDVTGLTKGPDGLWTATAKQGGKTMTVVLDFKGAVTPK